MRKRGKGALPRAVDLAVLATLVASHGVRLAAAENEQVLRPASEAGKASDAELELLRKLLGVPVPESAPEAQQPPEAKAEPSPEPEPAVFEPAPVAPAKSRKRPPAKPVAPKKKTAPAKPKAAASTTTSSTVSPSIPSSTQAGAATTEEPGAPAAASGETAASGPDIELPAPGTVVSVKNLEQWDHLLGPSVAWSIRRGATLDVVETKPMPLEPKRQDATQRYSAQVTLAADKRSIRNYVAGLPFPLVDENDPDAAPKMMFNMENRISQDDLDVRNFTCDTGKLDARSGFSLERHYAIEHFRRFYYTGRLWVDPKPSIPNPEGIRYLEMLYPLQEPFDLKGAGFTYIRYLDPNRQDDSWLYFPQLKRVRRIGTAQRSEGVFGQDIDLDSYGGYAGNPAWTTWTLLGKKTILASEHARNMPAPFQEAPADFFPDDVWEARDVYVILGISQLGGYNFGRRIIYLDAESWLVPYTEIYDLKGQLWRTLIHAWRFDTKPKPNSKKAVYDAEHPFISALTLVDMQQEHATRCQFPSADMPNEDGWYYHFGPSEGTTPEVFSVSNFITTGR